MGGRGSNAVRNAGSTANAPILERMDTSKLTESQRKVMDDVYNKVEYARTHTLDEWALNDKFHVASVEESIIVQRWSNYGFKSQQEAINSVKADVEEYKRTYEKFYRNDVAGRPLISASTNTLRALEKRGFIKIIDVGGNFPDIIEIVERRRK